MPFQSGLGIVLLSPLLLAACSKPADTSSKSTNGDAAALLATAKEVFAKHNDFYGHPDENASILTPEFATLLKRENACASKGQICAIDSDPWLGVQDGGMSEPYRWYVKWQSDSDAAVDLTYVFDTGTTKERRTVQLQFSRAASGKWLLADLVPPVGSSLATVIAENNYDDPSEQATITPSDIPVDAPRFEDYPAKPTSLPPVEPDVRTHPRSRMFRDALYAPEGSLVKFRLNSRLLIVIGGINETGENRGVSYFRWDAGVLKRIRFVAKPYTP